MNNIILISAIAFVFLAYAFGMRILIRHFLKLKKEEDLYFPVIKAKKENCDSGFEYLMNFNDWQESNAATYHSVKKIHKKKLVHIKHSEKMVFGSNLPYEPTATF